MDYGKVKNIASCKRCILRPQGSISSTVFSFDKRVTNIVEYLQRYMHEMISERKKSEKKDERYDLLSLLLRGSEDEVDSAAKLSDTDLAGMRHFSYFNLLNGSYNDFHFRKYLYFSFGRP